MSDDRNIAPLTPGAYIKARRCAVGKSVDDVAAQLATTPHIHVLDRAGWLALIEADVMPATFHTIVALRRHIPVDLAVLERLAAIQLGADLEPPPLCRICAAVPGIAAGFASSWPAEDLCTRCGGHPAQPAAAAR